MISVSVYKLSAVASMENVENLIQTTGTRTESVDNDEWPKEDLLQKRIAKISDDSFNADDEVPIPYILASASTERAKWKRNWKDRLGNLLPKDDRIITHHTNLLFFRYGNFTYVVFFTQNENISNAIKKDIFVGDWGAMDSADEYKMENDLLYWLVYRKMKWSGLIQDKGIYLTNISYYVGSALEATHTIKSSGERVCDLLGTMAHIFQDEVFDSLGVTVVVEGETHSFVLYLNGDIKINEVDYNGRTFSDMDNQDLLLNLCLSIYIKIIPALMTTYKNHKDAESWNNQIKEDFSKENGMNLLKRVIPSLGLRTSMTIGEILNPNDQCFVDEVAATLKE